MSYPDFTLINRWDDEPVSHVAGWVYAGAASLVRNKSRFVHYDWVLGGEFRVPFTFVNVVDGDATGFSAIWEAVDPDVLPLITTAALAVMILHSFVFKSIISAFALVLLRSIEAYYLRQKYSRKICQSYWF